MFGCQLWSGEGVNVSISSFTICYGTHYQLLRNLHFEK